MNASPSQSQDDAGKYLPASGGRGERPDGADVEKEHQGEGGLLLGACSPQLFSDHDTPPRPDHKSALTDGIGDRESYPASGDEVEGGPQAPNEPPQEPQNVPSSPALKISGHGHRLAREGLFHEIQVEGNGGEKRRKSEEHGAGVGGEPPFAWRHGYGGEAHPASHEKTAHDADPETAPGHLDLAAAELFVSERVGEDGGNGQGHAERDEPLVSLRLHRVGEDSAQDQRRPDRHGKGDGESGDGDRRDQKDVGEVEYRAPNHGLDDPTRARLMEIREKGVLSSSRASQSEREQESHDE